MGGLLEHASERASNRLLCNFFLPSILRSSSLLLCSSFVGTVGNTEPAGERERERKSIAIKSTATIRGDYTRAARLNPLSLSRVVGASSLASSRGSSGARPRLRLQPIVPERRRKARRTSRGGNLHNLNTRLAPNVAPKIFIAVDEAALAFGSARPSALASPQGKRKSSIRRNGCCEIGAFCCFSAARFGLRSARETRKVPAFCTTQATASSKTKPNQQQVLPSLSSTRLHSLGQTGLAAATTTRRQAKKGTLCFREPPAWRGGRHENQSSLREPNS